MKASEGVTPDWVQAAAGYTEKALFAVNLFCFGLFILSETLKLIQDLWNEWWASMNARMPNKEPFDLEKRKEISSRLTIDAAYIRGQARDAIMTFIAPLNDVYTAATGLKALNVADKNTNQPKKLDHSSPTSAP